MSAWAELVALAEHERDLVRDERWDEVPAASEALLRASQALGDPPAEARPHLERLAELQGEIHAGLSAGRAFTLSKLGKIDRGATAMRGYGYSAPATPSVDGRASRGRRPFRCGPSRRARRNASGPAVRAAWGLDPKAARAGRR